MTSYWDITVTRKDRTTFRVAPQLRSHAPVVGDYLPVVDDHSRSASAEFIASKHPPISRDVWYIDAVEI